MTETTGMDKMKQGRARLVLSQLFFGSCAISLKLTVDNSCHTAYTDGKVIGFNEAFINGLSMAEVETLICHEVLHCIMLHPLRLQGRDHDRANRAMDYVVNGVALRSNLAAMSDWLYDKVLSAPDKSFEMVYALLKTKEEKKNKPGDPEDKGQSGDQPDDQSGKDPGAPDDGQSAPGNSEKPLAAGEVRQPTEDNGQALGESARELLEQEWKVTATKALQAAQQCGKVPAGMDRLVNEIVNVKRDLEDVLRDFINQTIVGDYTWTRPDKRMIIHDLYTPTQRGAEIPVIAMVMDTSGSIGDEQIDYFQTKVNSVLMEYQCTIRVIYCDSRAHDGGEYQSADAPIALKPLGGGGTNFRPAFDMIKDLDVDPTLMIYYTDGYCESFPEPPDYPVLWALYGNDRKVPFGEVVSITPAVD